MSGVDLAVEGTHTNGMSGISHHFTSLIEVLLFQRLLYWFIYVCMCVNQSNVEGLNHDNPIKKN
jgi:hypothetical protein